MENSDTPTLQEIILLTRSELTKVQHDDELQDCGRACVELLPRDPDMCLQVAYQHLHDVPYKEVKSCWRRLYTDAALRLALGILEKEALSGETKLVGADGVEHEDETDWVTRVVKILDMILILAGAPEREEVVELWFAALRGVLEMEEMGESEERPTKRRRLDTSNASLSTSTHISETFPTAISTHPTLRYPISRATNLSLEAFQTKISNSDTQTPIIIEGALEHWPALHERPWNKPQYLLEKTLGGRRLVPVEIGRSYTDQGWGQKILSFGEFMNEYMFRDSARPDTKRISVEVENRHADYMGDDTSEIPPADTSSTPSVAPDSPQTGYLAQHDLFAQIPSLRADISIPDYCYATPSTSPTPFHTTKPVLKLEEPLLNAWFGPANTISPLHTDPYHNILSQAVGYKYIRLYAPDQTENLYPRSVDENGIDMSNTSEVDLDVAMGVWREISCWPQNTGNRKDGAEFDREGKSEWEEAHIAFKGAKYVEGVLGPGECLYIPVGWWHYVQSLTPSFSVSFWFN